MGAVQRPIRLLHSNQAEETPMLRNGPGRARSTQLHRLHAPYEKVALLLAESSSELGSEVKVIGAMQQQAAELEADRIVLLVLARCIQTSSSTWERSIGAE